MRWLLLALLLSGCTAPTFFADRELDADGDSFLPEEGDCDDREPAAHPAHPEICDGLDNDCDGAVDGADEDLGDVDGDGADACEDCDDGNAARAPGLGEVCDGLDGDCDGVVPEDEADGDGDGVRICAGDCADDDPSRSPAHAEVCDGLDTDCDGAADDADTDTADLDGDGAGACSDCDDQDAGVSPDAFEACDGVDTDCSGAALDTEVDLDGDGVLVCAGDCDDDDPLRFPDAEERCNGVDDDCDGGVPAPESDQDADGISACAGDCDDAEASVFPGAAEACDGLDGDCDGTVPPDESDVDGDGFAGCAGDCDDADAGVGPTASELCDGRDTDCDGVLPTDEADADGDGVRVCANDCDDGDPQVRPGLLEACDGLDTDCDGLLPDDESDADGDGTSVCAGDCADDDATRTPDAAEACEGLDTDCDGLVPEDELDGDGDGVSACAGDCAPADALVAVGLDEACDGFDNDCDGLIDGEDPDALDADSDGVPGCDDCDDGDPLRSPDRVEACGDSLDNDCDSLVDEPASAESPRWLAAGAAFSGQALFWNPDESGQLPSSPTRDGPTPATGEFVPRVSADFDGDGVAEVLLERVDLTDDGLDDLVRWGLSCFGAPSELPSSGLVLPGSQQVVAAGDVDGDGWPDVITRDAGGALRVLLNAGAGSFVGIEVAAALPLGARVSSRAADFDGDGHADLLACVPGPSSNCYVLSGRADGAFEEAGLLLVEAGLWGSPSWIDADGDGLLDVAVAAAEGGDPGAVMLYFGSGTGGVSPGLEAVDVAPAEETGAGDATLAVASWGPGSEDLALLEARVPGDRDRLLHALVGDGAGAFASTGSAGFLTSGDLLDVAGGLAAAPP